MSSESNQLKFHGRKFEKLFLYFLYPRKCLKVRGPGKTQRENINSVDFETKKKIKKKGENERGGQILANCVHQA